MAGELLEVFEGFAEHPGDQVEVDIEITVHEHVAEAGDPPEALAEALRNTFASTRQSMDEP